MNIKIKESGVEYLDGLDIDCYINKDNLSIRIDGGSVYNLFREDVKESELSLKVNSDTNIYIYVASSKVLFSFAELPNNPLLLPIYNVCVKTDNCKIDNIEVEDVRLCNKFNFYRI